MRRKNFRWWSKYNFILSAGLEGGTLLSAVLIFFCLQFPRHGTINVNWWGNTVLSVPFSSLFSPHWRDLD